MIKDNWEGGEFKKKSFQGAVNCKFQIHNKGIQSQHRLECQKVMLALTCPFLVTHSRFWATSLANKMESLPWLGN